MSCQGSEDAEGKNLKGKPSDVDDLRISEMIMLTATFTTDRCTCSSLLPIPVMPPPIVLEKNTGIYLTRTLVTGHSAWNHCFEFSHWRFRTQKEAVLFM